MRLGAQLRHTELKLPKLSHNSAARVDFIQVTDLTLRSLKP